MSFIRASVVCSRPSDSVEDARESTRKGGRAGERKKEVCSRSIFKFAIFESPRTRLFLILEQLSVSETLVVMTVTGNSITLCVGVTSQNFILVSSNLNTTDFATSRYVQR